MAYNKRQVIEIARDALIAQGAWGIKERSNIKGFQCNYGTSDPSVPRCAIGLLPGFPKECRGSKDSASVVMEKSAEFRALFDESVDSDFLDDVQKRLHDELAVYDTEGRTVYVPNPFNLEAIRQAANKLLEEYCT